MPRVVASLQFISCSHVGPSNGFQVFTFLKFLQGTCCERL